MVRRLALAVVGSLVAGGGSLGVGQQVTEQPFTVIGIVHMATSPDSRETVVSVDRDDNAQAADGLVDHAFRIQHDKGLRFEYGGVAAVTFEAHRLTVTVTPDIGWVFTVASRESEFAWHASSYGSALVQGLSHHWGPTVHRSHEDVAALLFAGACDGTDASTCADCEAGGPGVQGCTLGGNEGSSCSADCTEGFFACCNVGSCRCCPPREGGQTGSRLSSSTPIGTKRRGSERP